MDRLNPQIPPYGDEAGNRADQHADYQKNYKDLSEVLDIIIIHIHAA